MPGCSAACLLTNSVIGKSISGVNIINYRTECFLLPTYLSSRSGIIHSVVWEKALCSQTSVVFHFTSSSHQACRIFNIYSRANTESVFCISPWFPGCQSAGSPVTLPAWFPSALMWPLIMSSYLNICCPPPQQNDTDVSLHSKCILLQ